MTKNIKAIRGMHDILPDRIGLWHAVEDYARTVLEGYGYIEIRTPVVEMTELFKRSIGDVTDIVEKEMYSFEDRGGDQLSLRPEGTASCVRAAIENGLLARSQRLWYIGPMFRRERPQAGRTRQFHQIGVEVLGLAGPDVDLEIVLMTARLWKGLGLDGLRLELNTLGDPEERAIYRERLVAYLESNHDQLDADAQRRLHANPLRVLDSKNPEMRDLIAGAPSLHEYLGAESKAHFDSVCAGLERAGVAYEINPRLVRGLDYYNRTVFEWINDSLGAQNTICAGGRYDGLVAQLGGRDTPAVGFAMGLERLVLSIEQRPPAQELPVDIYLIAPDTAVDALLLAERLRDALPWLRLQTHCGGGSFKSQFKGADRSGARYALVYGEDEQARAIVGVKPLRGDGEQFEVAIDNLPDTIERLRTEWIRPGHGPSLN